MKVKTFILGWTIPLSYKPTKTSQLLLFSWKCPHWVLCMKKIFRGVSICSLKYMWTQNADPSFHRTPSLWTWRNESKLSALEFCLHIWLEAWIRTSEPVVMREDSCFSFGSARASSWTCYEGQNKFRPFLTIHFCFVFEKRPLERHNAFFFEWIDAVSKPGVLSHKTVCNSNTRSPTSRQKTWLIRWTVDLFSHL